MIMKAPVHPHDIFFKKKFILTMESINCCLTLAIKLVSQLFFYH